MATTLDERIQWLHKQIFEERYPNAFRISEKFDISHRQAQRDIDYLKNKMNAPVAYDPAKKGFFYTEHFSLPSFSSDANKGDYSEIMTHLKQRGSLGIGESETIQMQIPYSAEIEISDKLGILALGAMKKLTIRSGLWYKLIFSQFNKGECFDVAIAFRQCAPCYSFVLNKVNAKKKIGFVHSLLTNKCYHRNVDKSTFGGLYGYQ